MNNFGERQALTHLETLPRFSFGFGSLFDEFKVLFKPQNNTIFPPCDIYWKDDYNAFIKMAVAGYSPSEIQIEHDRDNRRLTIFGFSQRSKSFMEENPKTGEIYKNKKDMVAYDHQGIARRNFKTSFYIGDDCEVIEAKLINGELTIHIELELFDELQSKPIQIPIKTE